jgi:hypothetical protein
MINNNVMSQVSTVPGSLKNGNNVAVVADNGFTIVKRTRAQKETLSLHHSLPSVRCVSTINAVCKLKSLN